MFYCFVSQVEKVQEQIISLELQDPVTNTVFDETQLAALIPPTPMLISPSDDENSSIVTVRSTGSGNGDVKLHLAITDDDNNTTSSFVTAGTVSPQQQQVPTSTDAEPAESTIVEVVNPFISGDGHANQIAVGQSAEPSYASFDSNDNGNVADDEFDSLNAFEANERRELSLNDKMKNVLQELVTNERVRLSFSQSINEDDDDDGEDDDEEDDDDEDDDDDSDGDDTDDDENEPLNHDDEDATDGGRAETVISNVFVDESNGNAVIGATATEVNDGTSPTPVRNIIASTDDIVFENPNFLADDVEPPTIEATTAQPLTAASVQRRPQNEHDEKVKQKLLSELNIGERQQNILPAAVEFVDEVVAVAAQVAERNDAIAEEIANVFNALKEEQDDEDDDRSQATVTSTAESSSVHSASVKRSGNASKRRKQKSKGKRK